MVVVSSKETFASWEAFLEVLREIEAAKEHIRFEDGEECFYRGHPKREYELLPTLFRTKRRYRAHRDLEADLFFEFKARAHALHGSGLTDWDVLFFMRHHGVPTRLLDWTESLGIALYFALHDQDGRPLNESPCIHLLNPYSLNLKSEWEERDLIAPKYIWYGTDDEGVWDYGDILVEDIGMDWDSPIAIYPEQRSQRVRAQHGWFTLHGDDVRPIDQQVRGVTSKVEIPARAIPGARHFLKLAGLDHFAVYPDLDGLARTLIDKHTPAPKPAGKGRRPRRPARARGGR